MQKKISDAQMAQIKAFINTLPEEQREAKMQEIMAELGQEEESGTPQCPFCLMASGKLATSTVYEDNEMMGVLEINPANPGHILLFPKEHAASLQDVPPDVTGALLRMAQVLGNILKTFAEGVNILFSDGAAAGQRFPHAVVHIIPRSKGDAVRIEWQGKPLGEKEMAGLREKILGAIAKLSESKKKEPEVDISSMKEKLERQRKRRP